jgi:hypothetical protein
MTIKIPYNRYVNLTFSIRRPCKLTIWLTLVGGQSSMSVYQGSQLCTVTKMLLLKKDFCAFIFLKCTQ